MVPPSDSDGVARGDSRILCTNPLTGTASGAAPAPANLGTLVPNADHTSGTLLPGAVPARCDPRGILLIGDPPEMGSAVLPGNNYHVYDIPLFWVNLKNRCDTARSSMAQSLITDSASIYSAQLPDGGALLGIDLGTKTLGLALCDAGWRFATAAKTMPRVKFGKDAGALRTLIEERAVRGIVPWLATQYGRQRRTTGTGDARLRPQSVPHTLDLPVLLWDERWSTVSAERDMIGQDVSRRGRAERIDAHAAAVILQAAIDALTQAGEEPH